MPRLMTILLLVCLPLPAIAWPGSPILTPTSESPSGSEPAPEQEAGREAPTTTVEIPAALLNKKVVVHLRGGGVEKGMLVGVAADFLVLQRGRRTTRIPLAGVAFVEQRKSRVALGIGIAALAVGALALVAVIAASRD